MNLPWASPSDGWTELPLPYSLTSSQHGLRTENPVPILLHVRLLARWLLPSIKKKPSTIAWRVCWNVFAEPLPSNISSKFATVIFMWISFYCRKQISIFWSYNVKIPFNVWILTDFNVTSGSGQVPKHICHDELRRWSWRWLWIILIIRF
jgi:hypothetical protein